MNNLRDMDSNGMLISPNGSHFGQTNNNNNYTIPGILKYLQSEFARFELEKAQWKVANAEYLAQIAALKGKEKGQMNIRRDLIRRIKMLEFALKQERQKYYLEKTGIDLDLNSNGESDSEGATSSYESSDSDVEREKEKENEDKQSTNDKQAESNSDNDDDEDKENKKVNEKNSPDQEVNDDEKTTKNRKKSKKSIKRKKIANDKSKKEAKDSKNDTKNKTSPNDPTQSSNNNNQPNTTKQSEFYWRHGRQLLRQYLDEVGYTDAILNVRAKRLRALLDGNESTLYENLVAAANESNNNNNSERNENSQSDNYSQDGNASNNGQPNHNGNLNEQRQDDNFRDRRGEDHENQDNRDNNGDHQNRDMNNREDHLDQGRDEGSGDYHNFENLGTIKRRGGGSNQYNNESNRDNDQGNGNNNEQNRPQTGEDGDNDLFEYQKDQIQRKAKNEINERSGHFKALFNQLNKPIMPDVPDIDLDKQNNGNANGNININGHNFEDPEGNNRTANGSNAWWNNNNKLSIHNSNTMNLLNGNSNMSQGHNPNNKLDELNNMKLDKDEGLQDHFGQNRVLNNVVNNFSNMDEYSLNGTRNVGMSLQNSNNRLQGVGANNSNNSNDYLPKFTLKGHYETVRDFSFHPTETVVLSGSDDGTVKLWNLMGKSVPEKGKIEQQDSVYCHRMFDTPVLSTEFSHGGYNSKSLIDTCSFAGSAGGKLFTFNTPSINSDVWSQFDPASTIYCELVGHEDAVWSLNWNKHSSRLASASADGCVKIWNPILADEFHNHADEAVTEEGTHYRLRSCRRFSCRQGHDGITIHRSYRLILHSKIPSPYAQNSNPRKKTTSSTSTAPKPTNPNPKTILTKPISGCAGPKSTPSPPSKTHQPAPPTKLTFTSRRIGSNG